MTAPPVVEETQSMSKSISSNIKDIIITAVITSLLSVSGSYWLMSEQLAAEQDYWFKRQQLERIDRIYEKKTQIMEKVNFNILNLSTLLRDVKIAHAAHSVMLELCKLPKTKNCDMDTRELGEKYLEYFKEENMLHSNLQMAELYFGADVKKSILILEEALKKNYNGELPLNSIKNPIDYFSVNFDTIDEFWSARRKLLSNMREDIFKTLRELHSIE